MINDVYEYLNNTMPGVKELLSFRVNTKLEKLLKTKYYQVREKLPDMKYQDFLRFILSLYVLPEILNNDLDKELSQWITQPGEKFMESHYKEKINKLTEIGEITSQAIKMTENLQEEVLQLEVDYMNKVNKIIEKKK